MFAIIRVGYLKYKPHVLCIELNPLEHKNGSVRCLTPFGNRNQSQLATQNKARQRSSNFFQARAPSKKPKPQRCYIRMPHQAPLGIILLYRAELLTFKTKPVLDRFQDSSKTGSRICFKKCFFLMISHVCCVYGNVLFWHIFCQLFAVFFFAALFCRLFCRLFLPIFLVLF